MIEEQFRAPRLPVLAADLATIEQHADALGGPQEIKIDLRAVFGAGPLPAERLADVLAQESEAFFDGRILEAFASRLRIDVVRGQSQSDREAEQAGAGHGGTPLLLWLRRREIRIVPAAVGQ